MNFNAKSFLSKNAGLFLLAVVAFAWSAFELFNAQTTYDAFYSILGQSGLALCLTIAFCGMDVGGLMRVVAHKVEKSDKENLLVDGLLFGAWFLAAMFNAFMTYWAVAGAWETRQGSIVVPKVLGQIGASPFIPFFIALFVFIIRIALMSSFGKGLGMMIEEEDQPRRVPARSVPTGISRQVPTAFPGNTRQVPAFQASPSNASIGSGGQRFQQNNSGQSQRGAGIPSMRPGNSQLPVSQTTSLAAPEIPDE